MTPASLKEYTCKDLGQMAKQRGVPGWHSMRKDQLVRAIIKAAESEAGRAKAATKRSLARSRSRSQSLKKKPTSPQIRKRISQLQSKLDLIKNLAAATSTNGQSVRGEEERLVVMVRDPYWLHAYWELSASSIRRAQAAMGQHWHTARPVLQLLKVAGDGSTTLVRDIVIHGGVSHWYVDVQAPPCRFRLEIGYLAAGGSFHRIARSNVVCTPPAGVSEAMDENWADLAANADRVYAMSGGYSPQGGSQELQQLLEERLGRPMGSPMDTCFGTGASSAFARDGDFHLAVDAEMIVYGTTQRDAHVTLQGEPVRLRPDGTFTVRLNMPDRRQVIPVVASSNDGVEQRTISIAVERNTKAMEPVIRDAGG